VVRFPHLEEPPAPLRSHLFRGAPSHETFSPRDETRILDEEKSRKGSRTSLPTEDGRKGPSRNQGGFDMADKRSLGLLGFLFGGVTAAVSLTAFLLVQAHIAGHLQSSDAGLASQVTVGYR
jgi:hypothetical protein